MKVVLRFVLYVLAALIVTAAIAIALIVKLVLAPATGEWSQRVKLGPIGFDVGVPTVLRLVTASWFAPQLAGRSFDTSYGKVRFGWGEANLLQATCEPCSVTVSELGDKPLQVERLVLTARRDVDALFGSLRITPIGAAASSELRGRWTGRLSQKGLQLSADIDDAPIGQWYQMLVPALPELQRARIGGTASMKGTLALPDGGYSVHPRVVMLSVDGLGAEALLVSRAGSCGAPARLAGDAWLARGAVASLDADFFQHAGYESATLARSQGGGAAAPMAGNARPEKVSAARAVSAPSVPRPTFNEQVARLLLPPLPNPAAQQLRDLLYAVEFEKAPGKQRLLQAYLDIAPWGEQVCGAEAAARRYFRRSARSLEPAQAIWMGTMLRDPDAMLQKWRAEGQIDKVRARSVAEQVHEITAGQRVALLRGVANARFVAPAAP